MEDGSSKPLATATAQSTNDTSPFATETVSKQVLDKPKSRLESLPAEIRLMIWRRALPLAKELEIAACEDLTDHTRGWCYHKKDEAASATALAKLTSAFEPHSLALVTHEIRVEVLALVDRRRVFVLTGPYCVASFLRWCSTTRKPLIKGVCVKWDICTLTEAHVIAGTIAVATWMSQSPALLLLGSSKLSQ